MLFWFQIFAFVAGTAALLYVSRGPLSRPGSHGFYRFFAWECMLVLALVNLPWWHDDPFSAKQIISSTFFVLSIWLPIHAVRLLKAKGKPSEVRGDDPALYGFEKTSAIVSTGAFRYIRHPMYTALLLLAWGATRPIRFRSHEPSSIRACCSHASAISLKRTTGCGASRASC